MSSIKQVLFELMEQDHEIAKRRAELFGKAQEEKEIAAMGAYDHARADEIDWTREEEEE